MFAGTNELRASIQRAEKEFGCHIPQSLAEIFLEKLSDKKEGYEFGLAIRYSLNESHIWGKPDRKIYAALAGYFFGRRGNIVKAQLRREALKSEQKKQRPPQMRSRRKKAQPEFFTEPGGQRAFRI